MDAFTMKRKSGPVLQEPKLARLAGFDARVNEPPPQSQAQKAEQLVARLRDAACAAGDSYLSLATRTLEDVAEIDILVNHAFEQMPKSAVSFFNFYLSNAAVVRPNTLAAWQSAVEQHCRQAPALSLSEQVAAQSRSTAI